VNAFLFRVYYGTVYYLSWLLFGTVGFILNIVCIFLLLLPNREAHATRARERIRRLFDLFMRWIHFTGIVKVTWKGFDQPLTGGTVYIGNHPTLIDAPIVLSRIPDAICIFKPQLIRNPALGPAAIIAEYVSGDAGVDVIRTTAGKVAEGRSLLIFPEGTRTAVGEVLGTLRSGFALIASRARAPVQLIVIRTTENLVRKGRPWWRLPKILPAHVVVSLDRRWEHDPTRHAATLTAEVTERLQQAAAERVDIPNPLWKWKS
jgi:1-acyl-sn-glycerol-3-phosphate acyltransferase